MNKKLPALAFLTALTCSITCLAAEGKFGNGLNSAQVLAKVKALPEYNKRPLTVECWVKIERMRGYNVLISHEKKASSLHWEIYTRNGNLKLHSTEMKREAESRANICDDTWHYCAVVLEETKTSFFVDGKAVGDPEIEKAEAKDIPGDGFLMIGALVEKTLATEGIIDEVRISSIVRPVESLPTAPFEADEHTVGLWHFDEDEGATTFADASKFRNHGTAEFKPQVDLAFMAPKPDLKALRLNLQSALEELKLPSLADAPASRDALLRDWDEHYYHLSQQISGAQSPPRGAAEQVFDAHALVNRDTDKDPLGVVLRRCGALMDDLKKNSAAEKIGLVEADLNALNAAALAAPINQVEKRKSYFLAAMALQRQIAFANPLLDFEEIIFVARGVYGGSRKNGPMGTNDSLGQHFNTQYYGHNAIPGGGLFKAGNLKSNNPQVVNILKDSVVQSGRLKGTKLDKGGFVSPDLSYDGKQILFSNTQATEHKWVWNESTTFHVFKVNADGSNLEQLTDGNCNDFDPLWLPGGRIAFISERRGGYIRCFNPPLDVPNHVLHSMKPDGTDIYPISFFETSEWHPSVNNDGMLVYTRWDYTDRENCLGSNFWICYPDGRDPRAPHGNYPYPWHTFPDNTFSDSRRGRPYTEMNIRAIPKSHRYILTGAPHHGEAFGSLAVLDMRSSKDDGNMSQLKRLTPHVPFPETEMGGRLQYAFGTPWPLSENYYLVNWWENIYLLDRFGNQVLLVENALAFGGQINWDMRLIDPIPLRARPMPPAIPTRTNDGVDAKPDAPTAKISIMNVYETDQPYPAGTKIKYVRVVQQTLKENPKMGKPMTGYQNENMPKIPLGIVPVEEDGSAYFEAPVNRQLIFQVLDENYMAVQSMRSVAFVHRGEHLTCVGCHEDINKTPKISAVPMAMKRPPSKLQPEIGPVEPVFYYRTVKPIFEKSCVPCHKSSGKGLIDMDYWKLEPYAFYFAGGMGWTTMKPVYGGSRSIPGRMGAKASKMGQVLMSDSHKDKVSKADLHKIILWLDCNALRLGSVHDAEKQEAGELVWPKLDVDPENPQGLEKPPVK